MTLVGPFQLEMFCSSVILNLSRTYRLLSAMGKTKDSGHWQQWESWMTFGTWPAFFRCRHKTDEFHFMKLSLWYLDSLAVTMLDFEHRPTSTSTISWQSITGKQVPTRLQRELESVMWWLAGLGPVWGFPTCSDVPLRWYPVSAGTSQP